MIAAGELMMVFGFRAPGQRGRVLVALWLLLAFAIAGSAQRVAVLSDIEGSAKKLERFLAQHPAFVTGSDGLRHLAPDAYFVHGGDVPDRFAGACRVVDELLRLKREAPERVVLIAGNRDVNKLRLAAELSPSALRRDPPVRAADWHAWLTQRVTQELGHPPTPAELTKATTGASRLKWILERTMGAPDAFELRRKELTPEGGAAASDHAVVRSFLTDMSPGGRFHALLKASKLLARVGPTVFCHAGLTDENLGVIPGQSERAADIDAWITGLDRWYHAQLTAWEETAATWNGNGPRPAQALVKYAEPTEAGTSNQTSVIYSRNADAQGKITLPSPAVIAWLARSGVRRLCIGHTPSGEIPVPLRTPDGSFETLVVDNSRAPDSELPAWVTLDGDGQEWTTVRASLALDGGPAPHARTGQRQPIAYRARLGAATRLGQRLEDGQVLVAPIRAGWIGYQLEPGWKVVYRLIPQAHAPGHDLEILAP